jgi:hypothetical protein
VRQVLAAQERLKSGNKSSPAARPAAPAESEAAGAAGGKEALEATGGGEAGPSVEAAAEAVSNLTVENL